MEILFTFIPKEDQQQRLETEFPQVHFHFIYKDKTRLASADIIVTYGEDLTAEDVAAAEKVQWIMVASAGIEKLPHQAIAERGITVSNVKGIHKIPMAESALAHLLSLKRSLPTIYENQRNQEWSRRIRSSELNGSTALILGPGAIGSEIGRMLQAFGVYTIGCNRSGKKAPHMDDTISFENILEKLPQADYVLSILPSTDETKQLLKEVHFKAMKKTAIFMNFGRGDLVSDEILLDALRNEEIACAVLDVFEQEPLPQDHPYWTMGNVVVSPHVSSHSGKYVERALDIFIPDLKKWLVDQTVPTNLVNMEKGY
ncbi:D-3-phosphoglycerate dehydrogenase [Planococcus antarcticus DSM 14505]|uniref:D-2-hydroxyacid dehydrogenase n=1 Tax=Planococcus antarcticus DSM 14505 TaxID=1185653 RepID=A0A1C7DKE0_9BACL|nr:D-2-hydroxyacid dehydrogenase [Planococcus antarcticus]ANU11683.1 D-2-hydroxyacid dehydrogenase [Planococcus antarcticus DSM 14505]EIM05749.1 D-3-phosphoglycerate dehydrogenase [Planococcus antarcticus DSM 14505]